MKSAPMTNQQDSEHAPKYFGQFEQDLYLDKEVFRGREYGSFIEIGAADPIHGSNSFFLEKYRGWQGICIEARPEACKLLRAKRTAKVINAAVGPAQGKCLFLELGLFSGIAKYMSSHEFQNLVQFAETPDSVKAIIIDEIRIEDVLLEHDINPLDLLMIDTEGAEEAILRASLPTLKHTKVILAECNTRIARESLINFLAEHDFAFVKSMAVDNIFVNQLYASEFEHLLG